MDRLFLELGHWSLLAAMDRKVMLLLKCLGVLRMLDALLLILTNLTLCR